jgi:hypothetical protein
MQSLRHYFAETEHWADSPREGDELDIELAPDELVEGRVLESDGEYIVLEISESAAAVMKQRGLLSERIGRYGAVGSSRAMGYTVAEGVMSEIDIDLRDIAASGDQGRLIDGLQGELGSKTAEYLQHMMQEIESDMERQGRGFRHDQYRNLDILMDRIVELYADDDVPFTPDRDASDRDEFGNPIKHRARHLARRGMRQAMAQKPDEPTNEDYMPRMLELAGVTIAETVPIQPNPNAARTDPLAAKAADLAPVGTEKDPTTATTVDEGAMKDVATELAEIADAGDYDRLYDLLTSTSPAGEMVQDMYADVARDFRLHPDDDSDMILDRLMDRIADDFGGQLDEADTQPKHGDRPMWQRAMDNLQGNIKQAGRAVGMQSPASGRAELDRDIEANRAAMRDAERADKINEGYDQQKADAYNRAIKSGHSPEQAEKMAGIRDADMHFYEIDTNGQMKRLRVRAATAPVQEAEYQGRKVELNKPKRGGSKKFYVYVKDPTTKNIRKVSFGDPNMKIKKSNPARRKSFRARHRCDNPGPKTSARYWACRSW